MTTNVKSIKPTTRYGISQVVDGFILDCQAHRLSPNTISDYRYTFRKFLTYFGSETILSEIDRTGMRGFFAQQTVSNKTVRNYYLCLNTFFKFAISEKLSQDNPLVGIKLPKPETRVIEPIPLENIKRLMKTIDASDSVYRHRNRAILLLMLDCGFRVSEICGIKKSDLNLTDRTVKVFGKNSKERILSFSPSTAKSLWKHLSKSDNIGEYVFIANNGTPMIRGNITALLRYWCKLAGIPIYNPHRFRHTFAISFLRNGGNIYALQNMLGHYDLSMCARYLRISEVDVAQAQLKASPVMNLGL